MYAEERELEIKFSKNQLLDRVKAMYTAILPKADKFIIKAMSMIAIYKRLNPSTFVGLMYKQGMSGQEIIDTLLLMAQKGFMQWDGMVFIVQWEIPAEVQQELDLYQYPMPMVVEPEKVTNNQHDGHYYINGPIILGKGNSTNEDVNLDVINYVNKTKLHIDLDTAEHCTVQWNKPIDTTAKQHSYDKYVNTAKAMCKAFANNDIYLTHKYDKRGRIYCQGYYISYQGTDWNKAVLELSNKEVTLDDI